MKKFVASVLTLLLLLSTVALAEIDISSLSFDELLALNTQVQLALFKEKSMIDGVEVPAGTYVVGEDIPSGSYKVECTGGAYSMAMLTVNEKNGGLGTMHTLSPLTGSAVIGKLVLTEGQTIEITGGSLSFTTYTGLFGK